MQLIKSIEIRYLRSIHRLRIRSVGDLTIFSGANDVGKSNILKALNLFFNGEVNWMEALDFYQDFSLRRLNEVRRASIKGKQFIGIDITFNSPANYKGSLPLTFRVTRNWLRDSPEPQTTDDLERQQRLGKLPSTLETARRMRTQLLNRIRFEYVPAIRDRAYFEDILERLQETLIAKQMQKGDPMISAVEDLNRSLAERAGSLRQDFEQATNIEADVSLPADPTSLFRAFSVSTTWRDPSAQKEAEPQLLSLSLRGDGIQAVYVPLLLKYVADNSSLFFIWGFEEPENSIEYNLAIDLATAFESTYSNRAQVFLTSHSLAFVALRGSRTVCYRVHIVENVTEATRVHPSSDDPVMEQLSEDIGLFRIQEELYQEYQKRKKELSRTREELERLRGELEVSGKPVVYVEGKLDVKILETAWDKLFPSKALPYAFKGCSPVPEDQGGGAGGCETLQKLLSTVRADSPHVAIGIFDRDKQGEDAYSRIPNYFYSLPDTEDVKVSKSGRAGAILLPIPPGREEYASSWNLSIEFYFRDEVLSQKTEHGRGLVFQQSTLVIKDMFTGATIDTKESDLPQTRRMKDGKKAFAEEIVPSLDSSEFEAFRLIFEKIDVILGSLPS